MTGPREIDTAALRARYPDVFDRPASARLAMPAMIVAAFAILVYGLVDLDFSPSRFVAGLSQLGWISLMMIPPDPGSSLPVYLKALGETLSIALLGTTLAALFALPVSLLAARNVVPSSILRFPIRRFLDSIRGVDTLIWALVWINVVGLGPFAGVLAIAVSDFGAFGKLFSEAIEGADQKQVEGIRASGGSALHEIRFGLLPQVLPVIAGQVLYFIESNTRSATIIGIVGAGGIGLQLAEQIRVLEWQKVSFLILMILIAVAAIDFVSGKLAASPSSAEGRWRNFLPSPLVGEGGAKRRMRGLHPQIQFSACGDIPLTRLAANAASHPLPQGERGREQPFTRSPPETPPAPRQSANAWSPAACRRDRGRWRRPPGSAVPAPDRAVRRRLRRRCRR
ncbi:phosphonate ABC transporter permease subunit PhnE [Bradyrhizobium sp. USDA 3650]